MGKNIRKEKVKKYKRHKKTRCTPIKEIKIKSFSSKSISTEKKQYPKIHSRENKRIQIK